MPESKPIAFQPTARTTLGRLPARGVFDRETVYSILDEALVCHLGFALEGAPGVIPMAYAREGDFLFLHGSQKNRALAATIGSPACIEVTLFDGLVLARSAFHHSVQYRSVVVYGEGVEVTESVEKARVLDLIVEHIVPGRTVDARRGSEGELRATVVVRFSLSECSAKIRTGPPSDDKEDLDLDVWAGILPAKTVWGPPEAAPDLKAGVAAPEYVSGYTRPARLR